MADEFKHKDVGDELTKLEYHATDGHVADSQAAGDIIYCDGSYWKRLGKGANGLYLKAGSAPYWEAILEGDIPASIARDAEVAADIAIHAAIAAAHHTKYSDAEAVSAMGVLGDANPLNHNRAVEWGATEHNAIGDAAPHHAKYSDAEAKAAAVQAGAITNGVTKAPTHDAVYDVKVTADAAQTLAEVNAAIAVHAAIAASHHTKTINASELSAGELPSARLAANMKLADIAFIIDGGGSAITTGQKGHLEIPFACTIVQVTTLADQSGSIVVDIWKDTYANFPPTDADSITASAPPTLSSTQKAQDSTLTNWTLAIAAGDILAYNVDSITTVTRVLISLKVERT